MSVKIIFDSPFTIAKYLLQTQRTLVLPQICRIISIYPRVYRETHLRKLFKVFSVTQIYCKESCINVKPCVYTNLWFTSKSSFEDK